MTIIELRDRLTQIINENEAHGWGERNNSPVSIELQPSKRITEYYEIKYAESAWYGLNDQHAFVMHVNQAPMWRSR